MATTYKVLGQAAIGSTNTTNTISNKALTSNVATLTTGSAHSYAIGDVVTVAGVDTTFDGTFVVASVPSSTTFTYALTATNVTSAAVSPVGIVTRSPSVSGVAISNKYKKNNIATLTSTSHGLAVDDWAYVSIGDSTINGIYKVTNVPSSSTFTVTAPGTDIASTACGGAYGERNNTATLYTVPSATQTVVSTINVCNRGTAVTYYRIAVRPAGASIANQHYIAYDSTLAASDSVMITVGMTLGAADVITVYSSAPDISFTAFGSEIA